MADEVRIWIDIGNPPQVQYLAPFRDEFIRTGATVLVTAQAYKETLSLLHARDVPTEIIGAEFGRSRAAKSAGTALRAVRLRQKCTRWGRPLAALSSTRAAAMASRLMGVPHFAIIDYEHVNLDVYRRAGTTLLFPEVIPEDFFLRRGFSPGSLIPFAGIKEDLSFTGVRTSLPLGRRDAAAPVRVLVRLPGESVHYYVEESGRLMRSLLTYLAPREDVQVVYSPRHTSQLAYLEGVRWAREPIVLNTPTPFPDVLTLADAVVSAGGTMVREAAFLGIPAFTTFRGDPGAVDLHLAAIGRLTFLRDADDFALLDPVQLRTSPAMEPRAELLSELARSIVERAFAGSRD